MEPEELMDDDNDLGMPSVSNLNIAPQEYLRREAAVSSQMVESLMKKRIGQKVLVAGRSAEDTAKPVKQPSENCMFFLPDVF